MKKVLSFFIAVLFFVSCNPLPKKQIKPNIIFFLADDLGYGETGAYGQQKIKTPNVDALAESGMKFTRHYSGAPVCAPARCVFLTGKHAGHAYIRGNDEWPERGDVWDYKKACLDPNLEGQRPLPANTVTIGTLLQKAGYTTAVFGKWGLGAPESVGAPNNQGFDYFFGYNCQRQAHNLYPPHLWENETKVQLNNEFVPLGTKLDSLTDVYEESNYERFTQHDYAPELINNKALAFIENNKGKPFFMYYATVLPHVSLQAPKEWVDKYRQQFGDEEPYRGGWYYPCRYPRATYAAMISYMDYELGALITKLKELGIYDNTIIVFTSDNGPTYTGGVDFDFFESSKPLSNGYGRTKGFVYEGGIRVPMIACWKDHINQGTENDYISCFYDFMPTFCDVANVNIPKFVDGISLMPEFLGDQQKEHDFLYWEFPSYKGQQAVRMGRWKGIRKNILKGNMTVELYDLEDDIEEKNNVADQHPDIVKKIENIMKQEHLQAANPRFRMKQLGDVK